MRKEDGSDAFCAAFWMCAAALSKITLTVSLGIYAYNNPDPEASYAVVDHLEGMYSKEQLRELKESDADVRNVSHVHSYFHAWLLWGFYLMLSPYVIFCCSTFVQGTTKGTKIHH